MRREGEEEVATSSKRLRFSDSKKGFWILPREIRDQIYELCQQDTRYAHDGSRNGLATNSWTIHYNNGPSTTCIRQLCREIKDEFDETMFDRMQLTVELSMNEESITGEAPWQSSLPTWIHDAIRCIRIVVSLGYFPDLGQRFSVQDMYDCLQRVVDYAAMLPSISALDIMLFYQGEPNAPDRLHHQIQNEDLNMRQLLSTRPTHRTLDNIQVGLLVETRYMTVPTDSDRYWEYWRQIPEVLAAMQVAVPRSWHYGMARWYATLPRQENKSYTYLGLDWTFVAYLPDIFELHADGSVCSDDLSELDVSDVEDKEADVEPDVDDCELLQKNSARCSVSYSRWYDEPSTEANPYISHFIESWAWVTQDDEETVLAHVTTIEDTAEPFGGEAEPAVD